MSQRLRCAIATTAVFALLAPHAVSAQAQIGEGAFMKNCAACHGVNGRGNGPVVDFLKEAPSDLTKISERNGGVFPIEQVFAIIADAERNRAHGTSEMPIWGDRFNTEVIEQEGEYGSGQSSLPTAQARVLELVYFLATIQE